MEQIHVPCAICLDFDIHRIRDPARVEIYSCNLEAVHRSAKTCTQCSILLRAVQHCYPEAVEAKQLFNLKFHSFGGKSYQHPHAILGLGVAPTIPTRAEASDEEDPLYTVPHGWDQKVIHVFALEGKPCPWPLIGTGVDLRSDHESLAKQVKSWINECEISHPDCTNINEGVLPKRVIQVSPGLEPELCNVRLHETSTTERAMYVCLSHCWGGHQIIATTIANREQHMEGIPWEELSTTFKDAIRFTLALGLQYIWIDSLCIIQDSTSDWETEATKMAAYYTNAYITLAASAAADGTIGLYPKHDAKDEAIEIEGTDADGEPYYVLARTAIKHPFEEDEYGYHEFPLMARGWVHQEHILSHRFVHFGTRELLWECHSATKCQCGIIRTDDRPDYNTNQVLSVAKGGINTHDLGHVRRLWYDNVEAIMNLDFTFVKDRLPAAAGVATVLARAFRGRYLAGLWEDTLIFDLCWVIHESGRRPSELDSIPSWSWGSVSGGLAMLWCESDLTNKNVKSTAKVIGIDCGPKPSILGDVGHGIITLEGSCAHALLSSGEIGGHRLRTLNFRDSADPEATFRNWHFHPDMENWKLENAETEILLLEMMVETVDGHTKSAVFLVLHHAARGNLFKRVGLLRAQVRMRQRLLSTETLLLDQFHKAATMMTVSIG
ncbi:hypothetical protein HJFPF1_09316 [Paramyrothecium foliicola]|nr:hypothetical protein HJFPF1_09316 [Paramyrothecium foliicola]